MTDLGQIPADSELENAVWDVGDLTLSIQSEASMAPLWLPADGRRVVKTGLNAALFAKIGHVYEVIPNNDLGDGKFRVPAMMDVSGNSSQARMPMGQDEAAGDELGELYGQLGHTHAAGTLAAAIHTHGAGGYTAPAHGHGHSLTSPHYHSLFNDTQPLQNFSEQNADGAVAWIGTPSTLWYQLTTVNPGVGGAISNAAAAALSGSLANAAAANFGGTSAAADPPWLSLNWYVKL